MQDTLVSDNAVVVVGGGPAGLMAAEVLAQGGVSVDLCDHMASVGRKFLIAGKGGLNLTHAEPTAAFRQRYAARAEAVGRWLDGFDAEALRAWARDLGFETIVGSSGRVFPADLKAAPLLRAWVRRLKAQGVRFHLRQRWQGFIADAPGTLAFSTADGAAWSCRPRATVLALGGGSWPVLGSDGAWVAPLRAAGVAVAPLEPANCGFEIVWSDWLKTHFAGTPLKPVRLGWQDAEGHAHLQQGELLLTEHGLEGGLLYAHAAGLRGLLAAQGAVRITLDLAPGRTQSALEVALAKPRGKQSWGKFLSRQTGLDGVRAALLNEVLAPAQRAAATVVAATIKALPLTLRATRPLAEAISSAGGVELGELDSHLMLKHHPGVFCAGEMLDWEAPTGGYLLTAAMASGRLAGAGALAWVRTPRQR